MARKNEKKEYKSLTTPIGSLKYAFLGKKDQHGNYKVSLYLDEAATRKLSKELEIINQKGFDDYGDDEFAIYETPLKKDDEGKEYFHFKTNNYAPKVIDSMRQEVPKEFVLKIGTGSMGKVTAGYAYTTYKSGKKAGATFYLNLLQLSKFVEYDPSTAHLGNIEGGFTVANAAVPTEDSTEEQISDAENL